MARGGSWADRPADAGSAVRRAYEPWQKVYDVGFRVIVEEERKWALTLPKGDSRCQPEPIACAP